MGIPMDRKNSAMEYVTLPGTDLVVSRVCLGTQQFSGSTDEGTVDVTWGAMPQEEVTKVVHEALDLGINFFDCAEGYGKENQAEKALGAALEGRRSEAVIATKFGKHRPLWECDGLPEEEMYTIYTPEDVKAAIEKSLKALRTDYIDLYQVHWPVNVGLLSKSRQDQTALIAVLEEAKQAGRIRHYGVCNFGTDDLGAFAAAGGRPATNQVCYNLLWRSIEHGVLPRCLREDVGVLCYSPLQQGVLSGKFESALDLSEGRRRTRLFDAAGVEKSRHGWAGAKEAQEAIFEKVLPKLREAAAAVGCSMVDLSVAWLLSQPGVSCVIVGASAQEQVRRNAKVPLVAKEALKAATEATEALKAHVETQLDQYAAVERIHGNAA